MKGFFCVGFKIDLPVHFPKENHCSGYSHMIVIYIRVMMNKKNQNIIIILRSTLHYTQYILIKIYFDKKYILVFCFTVRIKTINFWTLSFQRYLWTPTVYIDTHH